MAKTARKPEGGFCFVPAMALLRAWWAYKAGIIERVDLWVWFACSEAVARRCGLQKGRVPCYSVEELAGMVPVARRKRVQESLTRLDKAGLVCWSGARLTIGEGLALEELDSEGELRRMAGLAVNFRRKVPVPRRVLRYLANGRREVVIATVLGHLLRCVYYRQGGIRSDGLVKASWIAELFCVHERNVKAARRELSGCGMISLGQANQFVLNRYGLPTTFNLEWHFKSIVKRRKGTSKRPPRVRAERCKSPPPIETGNSLSRIEHQQLGVPSPHGVRKRTGSGAGWPRLTTQDLSNPRSVQGFYEFAALHGLCPPTEYEQLRVFAAAAHATRVGTINPPGLFIATLLKRREGYVTQVDEDVGRLMRSRFRDEIRTWTIAPRPPLATRCERRA
jgi:hypothetical protein